MQSDAHQKAILMEVERAEEKSGLNAGATEQAADVKGALVQFMWWLKKEGYSDATAQTRLKLVKQLAKE
jgi:hypothetical protein